MWARRSRTGSRCIPTCHSLRLLRIGDRPRRLLEAVRGIDLVELEGSRECCGFGGTFAIKNADTSMAMLSDKLRHILDTRAEVCTAADTSCLMQHRRRAAPPARGRADDAPGRDPGGAANELPGRCRGSRLLDSQLRRNIGRATTTIRAKRLRAVAELPDWEALRDAGEAIKARAMATLPSQLERLEESVTRAGGIVHWARDGAEANAIVARIAHSHGAKEVIKVKSLATDEIGLNEALKAEGIHAQETDLAELIVQLTPGDKQSHILVPAIHHNRAEIRTLFEHTIAQGQSLGTEPRALAEAARKHLRAKFLSVPVAFSGANFGIAETGTIGVVESEGNGRMCITLPRVLVTLMGIEKVLPDWRDLEVFLQLLPRSATAERMNPYTSLWTGVRENDGPQEFHLILLDGGRTQVLADEAGRATLHCIRCSACLNVCPVYERVGGRAYESVYPGPIGAILTPLLRGLDAGAVATVGVLAVRRLLRGLPGQDRHPLDPAAPARARRARAEVEAHARGARDEGHGGRLRLAPALRGGPATRATRTRAPGQRGRPGLERDARPARGAEGELPRLVAHARRAPAAAARRRRA